jgi:hypothetical protein
LLRWGKFGNRAKNTGIWIELEGLEAPLRWPIDGAADLSGELLNGLRQPFERNTDSSVSGFVGGYFVVAAAPVLHERLTRCHRPGGTRQLQSAHWS